LIIIVSQWKKKILQLLAVILVILVFAAAIPLMTGQLNQYTPAVGGWFEDEHPSGNPMRVENEEPSSKYDQVMDQFVIKLQDFYLEDRP
jgi:hypothetical protein